MIAQEVALIAVGIVHQTDRLAKRNRLCVSKIAASRIAVTQRTQQEGRVHLRRAGVFRLERGRSRARRQAVFIQILYIRFLPGIQIGKRRGILQRLCFRFLAQQTHQHGRRLGACRRAIQLIALLCALEQAEILELICTVAKVSSPRRCHQANRCHSRDQRNSDFAFHRVSSFY